MKAVAKCFSLFLLAIVWFSSCTVQPIDPGQDQQAAAEERAKDETAETALIVNDSLDAVEGESSGYTGQSVIVLSVRTNYTKDNEMVITKVEQVAGYYTTNTIVDDILRTTTTIHHLDGNKRISTTTSGKNPNAKNDVWNAENTYRTRGVVSNQMNDFLLSSGTVEIVWKKDVNSSGKVVVFALETLYEINSVDRNGVIHKRFNSITEDADQNKKSETTYFKIYPNGKVVKVHVYFIQPEKFIDEDGIVWTKTLKLNGYVLSRWFDEGEYRFFISKHYNLSDVLQLVSTESKKRGQVSYSEVTHVYYNPNGNIRQIVFITFTYVWQGDTCTIIRNVDGTLKPVTIAESPRGYTVIVNGMMYRVEFLADSIIKITWTDNTALVKVSMDGSYFVQYLNSTGPTLNVNKVFGGDN